MVTNKYKKNVRRLFVLFVVSIVCFFAFFYQSMQQVYSSKVYYFINNLRIMYPEVDVPSALLSNILQFQITPLMWLLGFIAVALLILMYYYIHSFHKAYSKDINRIIDQMDEEDFIPSSLEGELSLLEDKIYAYKKDVTSLREKSYKEKRELSDYIENIAHQIKTPIASIRLNEEMAELSHNTELLKDNTASFDRLQQLFDNFMKLSRIENDTIHFNLEIGSIEELMNEVEEIVSPILGKTILSISTHDESFFYDKEWLSEAIYNIIKNCIEEKVTKIHIETYSNNEFIHIKIKDNGKGIDEEALPHIFERFYRANKQKNGHGIGLAVVKEIIMKHHGYINAYNEDGAVFDLAFAKLDVKEKMI